jgi:hypothetical protein
MAHQVYGVNSMADVTGRIRALRPNAPATIIQDWINDRIRQIIDRKPQWSGQIRETILYLPAPYNTGTVEFFQNSTLVAGTGVSWPINDAVSTTIPSGVIRTGMQSVVPASMDNISPETYLYVDDAGDSEVVGVVATGPTSFTANFRKFHNPGCTVWSSSFSGLQMKLQNTMPIFTINAVTTPTTAIVDMPWRAPAQSGINYSIRRMYTTISPDIKSLISVVDQAQGIPPLRTNATIQDINRTDPQRSSIGYPQMIAFRGPSTLTGNIQYEVWPATQSDRQLRVMYSAQPPKLISESDRIPFFINPTVLFNGVMASALSVKLGGDDIYYDPNMSRQYEMKFEEGLNDMILADEEHVMTYYSALGGGQFYGGSTYWQSHDWDVQAGRF